MFKIEVNTPHVVELIGRLDAANESTAREALDAVAGDTVIDFGQLRYISSAGLGLLFAAKARLDKTGNTLTLRNLSPHIREIFGMAGFDKIFTIE